MCYDKRRATNCKSFHRFYNSRFGFQVDGAGGFVENQNWGLLQVSASESNPLALATG